MKKKKELVIPITDKRMTRFNISLQGGVEMVMHAIAFSWGGEIFVPKIPSYNIIDVAKAVAPECEIKIVGIRPGEKIHEEMITNSDSFNTYDLGKYYTILPSLTSWDLKKYINTFKAVKTPEDFNYSSGKNDQWETVDSLRKLIKLHIDPNFKIS